MPRRSWGAMRPKPRRGWGRLNGSIRSHLSAAVPPSRRHVEREGNFAAGSLQGLLVLAGAYLTLPHRIDDSLRPGKAPEATRSDGKRRLVIWLSAG